MAEEKPEINKSLDKNDLEKSDAPQKEELEKQVMRLRQKLQILEWDAQRDQINPAKRFELEQIRKEYQDLKSSLEQLEAQEKPKEEKPEKDDLPGPDEKENLVDKAKKTVKNIVDKVEEKLHLKKEDEDFFKDEVEADEELEAPEAPLDIQENRPEEKDSAEEPSPSEEKTEEVPAEEKEEKQEIPAEIKKQETEEVTERLEEAKEELQEESEKKADE